MLEARQLGRSVRVRTDGRADRAAGRVGSPLSSATAARRATAAAAWSAQATIESRSSSVTMPLAVQHPQIAEVALLGAQRHAPARAHLRLGQGGSAHRPGRLRQPEPCHERHRGRVDGAEQDGAQPGAVDRVLRAPPQRLVAGSSTSTARSRAAASSSTAACTGPPRLQASAGFDRSRKNRPPNFRPGAPKPGRREAAYGAGMTAPAARTGLFPVGPTAPRSYAPGLGGAGQHRRRARGGPRRRRTTCRT